MLERLDFWLAIGTLGMLGWLEFNRLVRPAVRRIAPIIVGVLSRVIKLSALQTTTQHTPLLITPKQRAPFDMSSQAQKVPDIKVDTSDITPDTAIDIAKLSADLTDDQVLTLLLWRKTKNGEWRFSGRKLFALWGGNYNAFIARVAVVRGEQTEDIDDTLITPIAGRTTRASLYRDSNGGQEPS